MALINRDKSPSEQRVDYNESIGLIVTGVTIPVVLLPENRLIEQVQVAAYGVSGSPFLAFELQRFIAGSTNAGFTAITGIFASLAVTAFGTSGDMGFSALLTNGSSQYITQAGDVVVFRSSGSNSAIANLSVEVVTRALQDIRSYFGQT